MEWISAQDLLVLDDNVTCCDKGNKVMMICTSAQCRKKQRLICMKCSQVHQDHSNELVKARQFIKYSSERHDTTKRIQNFTEDLPSQPINYVDSIVNNSIAQQKQRFVKQMQELQQRISLGVKKSLGQMEAFQRSKENVYKLDKKKGATLETLPSEQLEMIIDMYWKQAKEYDCESDVPHFVEEQIVKCSDGISSLLNDVMGMINEEVNKCLSRVKTLIKSNRIEEIKKQMDKEDRDNSPPRFPKPRNFSNTPARPISSRVFSKAANIDEIETKINQQQDLIKKDLEKLQDNKANLNSENNNLQELNERYFQSLAERIQAKKSEIERMEKSRNIQNLKIARNQLNSLIREQVQNYKSFNAQQLRVDNKILEVMKNLEYKEEELHESRIVAQKLAIQKTLQKSSYTINDLTNNDDVTCYSIDDSPQDRNDQITQSQTQYKNSRPHSYSNNNLSGYSSLPNQSNNNIRIQTRKQSTLRNQSVTKERGESNSGNQNIKNKSFYSVGTSFQIGDSSQFSQSDKKGYTTILKSTANAPFMNINNNHLYSSTRTAFSQSQTQASPQKSKRPSTMMSSQDSDTTAAFSPVKVLKRVN